VSHTVVTEPEAGSAPIARISRVRATGWYAAVAAISLAIALPVFVRLTAPTAQTDIMHHARLAKTIIEHGGWLSYSLWYPLVFIFSDGGASTHAMRLASVGLLTLVVISKSVLVYWAALRALASRPIALAISFAITVIMPIIDPARPKNIYLGQIAPNVWHNSTNILAAPFAIAAFLAAISLLRVLSVRNALVFSGLVVLAALAKPNYPIAFLPVVGVATLVLLWRSRTKFSTSVLILAIAYVPVLAALCYQYLVVYVGAPIVTSTKPSFDPLAVWRAFSPNIPLSLALSLAGPILVFVALRPDRRRSLPVVLSWVALLIAIAQAALLGEQDKAGHLVLDGNWFWGAYTALAIVFFVSFIELVRLVRSTPHSLERNLIIGVAVLALVGHIAAGVYYVLNIGAGDYPSY
jgi:hypothetical protein